jgi:hypothetical protein
MGGEASPDNNDADPWLLENTGKNYTQHTQVGSVDQYQDYWLVKKSPTKGQAFERASHILPGSHIEEHDI